MLLSTTFQNAPSIFATSVREYGYLCEVGAIGSHFRIWFG